MVAQNQDPNRFEVFEGALRAKVASKSNGKQSKSSNS